MLKSAIFIRGKGRSVLYTRSQKTDKREREGKWAHLLSSLKKAQCFPNLKGQLSRVSPLGTERADDVALQDLVGDTKILDGLRHEGRNEEAGTTGLTSSFVEVLETRLSGKADRNDQE